MKEYLEAVAQLLGVNQKSETYSEMFEEDGKVKEGIVFKDVAKKLFKNRLDDVHMAGARSKAEQFEGWIKRQEGFKSEAIGEKLLEEYTAKLKAEQKAAPPTDDSEWKKKYDSLAPQITLLQEQMTAKEREFQAKEEKRKAELTAARLSSDARKVLGSSWSGDDSAFGIIETVLKSSGVQYGEDGKPILTDAEGKQLLDQLHKPITFEDKVKELGASIGGFTKKRNEQPPGGPGGPPQKTYTLQEGLSPREFNRLLDSAKPEEREMIRAARIAQLEK